MRNFRKRNFILGQQDGYTKYPCFIFLWHSRAITDPDIKNGSNKQNFTNFMKIVEKSYEFVWVWDLKSHIK